jgi:hypothetical protein
MDEAKPKQETIKKQASGVFLRALLMNPADGGETLLRKFC